MNGFSEAHTAEEFKKSKYRFLIAANKFQTGFDQSLLSVMYVDKVLTGVNAVQTLSRLNRTHPGKQAVFVLDFVNDHEEIRQAFQPYYTTTILAEGTDPNLLYDLKNDLYGFKAFSSSEVGGFAAQWLTQPHANAINSLLDVVVTRINEHLPEEKNDFIGKLSDYIKRYAFLSQIISFADPELEELYIFLKLLRKKVKRDGEAVPVEVLESVDFTSYKLVKEGSGSITLDQTPMFVSPMGSYVTEPKRPELDVLSQILKDVNDRYGTTFTDADRVILSRLSETLARDADLQGSLQHNSRETARVRFDDAFEREIVKLYTDHFQFYKKVNGNQESRNHLVEKLFTTLYGQAERYNHPVSR